MTASHYTDVYNEVLIDHLNVKDLFHRYKQSKDINEKGVLINTLVKEIATHSEAEEATVYNDLEKHGLQPESKELRDEHQKLEEVLYSLDYTKITDPEFEPKFIHAMELFIKHSDREEDDILLKLKNTLTPEENEKIATQFVGIRKVVPDRPHPMAPQSGSLLHKVLGMMTLPHDKILETIRGQKFLQPDQLKYVHGDYNNVEVKKIDPSELRA